jgi:hypothetical protein
MKRIIYLVTFLLFTLSEVSAQTVTAKLDSTQIKIGEQTVLRIQAIVNDGQKVVFPVFRDSIVNNLFLVNVAKPDTQKVGNRLQITRAYTVTSFDSALYYIPPMVVKIDNRDFPTASLALKVMTVPVDVAHPDRFYGLKPNVNAPFVWSDWIGMILCSLLSLLLVAALIYLAIRLHDNKPIIRRIKVEPKLSPHQLAMKQIEEIKSEKLSLKKENPKEYYTRLTEAIRTYIRERFGFNALEMTSQEIIDKLMEMHDQSAIDDLKELFSTADLVKFAKWAPELNENDANLVKAVDFINQTKRAEDEKVQNQPTEITIVEKRSLRTKRLLIAGIVVLSLAIIGTLVYVGSQMYELLF